MGVQGYMRGKEMEQEAFYRDNKTVFGGPAFGGTDEPLELLAPFIDRAPPSPTAPAGQQQPDPFVTPEAALTQQGAPQGLLTPQQKQGFADAQQAGAAAGPTATDLLAQQQSAQPPPTQQGGPAPFPGNIRPELLGVA